MLMFPVGLWMLWIGYKYSGKEFYKPFAKFIGFGIINFLIFSSYNYILNLVDFGSLFGPLHFQEVHKNLYGIKGAVAGFIKHVFLFFDFTGFTWNETLGTHVFNLRNNILHTLNLDYIVDGLLNKNNDKFNRTLIEPLMGMGILGFLLYLPCWIYSLIKPIFSKKETDKLICSFGLILLGTIIVMSYGITYMVFSIRFLTSFCVVAAPILVFSYTRKNNIPKFIISYFALFGLLAVSTHLSARPFLRIINYMTHGFSIQEVRYNARCALFQKTPNKPIKLSNHMCVVENKIRELDKNKKILYFPNKAENILPIKMLGFDGYKIDFILLPNIQVQDINDYDILVIKNHGQEIANIKNNTVPKAIIPIYGVVCRDFPIMKDVNLPNKEKIFKDTFCMIYDIFYKNYKFNLTKSFPFNYYIYEKPDN